MFNQFQADLDWHAGPVKTLRMDDEIAITADLGTYHQEITYREFNHLIRDCAALLTKNHLNHNHRIMVVGDNTDFIASVVWTWAVMYIGATAANSSKAETPEQIHAKAKAANCTAIVDINGRLEFLQDVDTVTKGHPKEKYLLYSSGTTKKPEGVYTVTPQFFTFPDDWNGGIAHIETLGLAYRFLGCRPFSQLACHGWEVAYAPHNVTQSLLAGGTYHWVKTPEQMPEAHERYNVDMISNYPLSFDPIINAWNEVQPKKPVYFVEVAGGIVTPQLIERLRDSLRPRIISNSYISSASGTILSRTIDHNDNPEDCVWLEPPYLDPTLKLRQDNNGVLWFKRKDGKYITDYDVFERKGKYYKLIGKAAEEFIEVAWGKVSTWKVEQFANQLTRTVWGCGEHTYAFSCNGIDGFTGVGLVYSGPLEIEKMRDHLSTADMTLRPEVVYHVKPEFWALNIKVSRDHMSQRLLDNHEYIINSTDVP